MVTDTGALAVELVAALNDHDEARVAALYAEDYEGTDISSSVGQQGREGVAALYQRFWQGFPDLWVTVRQSVVQGDRVALHWSARGTHSGSMLHIPATNREVEVQGMLFLEFRDGLIVRGSSVWDMAGLLRALGLLPDL
jgi:steroid delta-isomerase-like uncharacterized protein